MAPGGVIWRVTCEDGVVRHGLRDLVTDEQVDEFAEHGHCCTRYHDFTLVCELCLEAGHMHSICPYLIRWRIGSDVIVALYRSVVHLPDREQVGVDRIALQLFETLLDSVGSAFCEPYNWQFNPYTMNTYR